MNYDCSGKQIIKLQMPHVNGNVKKFVCRKNQTVNSIDLKYSSEKSTMFLHPLEIMMQIQRVCLDV